MLVALSWATSADMVHAWVMSSSAAEGLHQRASVLLVNWSRVMHSDESN